MIRESAAARLPIAAQFQRQRRRRLRSEMSEAATVITIRTSNPPCEWLARGGRLGNFSMGLFIRSNDAPGCPRAVHRIRYGEISIGLAYAARLVIAHAN